VRSDVTSCFREQLLRLSRRHLDRYREALAQTRRNTMPL
jgi:hypothetical protein